MLLGVPSSTLRCRLVKFGESQAGLAMVFSPASYKAYRRATLVTYNGMTKSLKEWAEYAGLKRTTFELRLKKGYTMEEALRKNPRYQQSDKGRLFGGKQIVIDGVKGNIKFHAERIGISRNTVGKRLERGIPIEKALKERVLTPEETQENCIRARYEKRRRDQAAALGIVL